MAAPPRTLQTTLPAGEPASRELPSSCRSEGGLRAYRRSNRPKRTPPGAGDPAVARAFRAIVAPTWRSAPTDAQAGRSRASPAEREPAFVGCKWLGDKRLEFVRYRALHRAVGGHPAVEPGRGDRPGQPVCRLLPGGSPRAARRLPGRPRGAAAILAEGSSDGRSG